MFHTLEHNHNEALSYFMDHKQDILTTGESLTDGSCYALTGGLERAAFAFHQWSVKVSQFLTYANDIEVLWYELQKFGLGVNEMLNDA